MNIVDRDSLMKLWGSGAVARGLCWDMSGLASGLVLGLASGVVSGLLLRGVLEILCKVTLHGLCLIHDVSEFFAPLDKMGLSKKRSPSAALIDWQTVHLAWSHDSPACN